jgi:N-acetylglucosaminyldiphosphoundecaprenol N-acetyl-beta-D-mannosaminyltransferase
MSQQVPLPESLLMGMRLARVDYEGLLDHLFGALGKGRGGWLITANLDFLRRYHLDAPARALYDQADVRVADGMPLVWALAIQGQPTPGRVAGSSLTWRLCERAAQERRSVYLLGGEAAANERAAEVLTATYPGLVIAGRSSPMFSMSPTPEELAKELAELERLRPDLLLVGLGSPKQEHVIQALRAHLPATWMVGVGISFSFVAGHVKRAPPWLQALGLEWVHRLAQEPRRLAKRYLVHDLPFAVRLLGSATQARLRGVAGEGP